MSYLDELFTYFRSGVKIRRSWWGKNKYIKKYADLICDERGHMFRLDSEEIGANDWEFYQEPISEEDAKNGKLKFGWYWVRNNRRGIIPDQWLPNGWMMSNKQSVEEVLAPCNYEEMQKLKTNLEKCKAALQFYKKPLPTFSLVNIATHHELAEKTLEEIENDC